MSFEIARVLVDYSLGLVGIIPASRVWFTPVRTHGKWHSSGFAFGVNRDAAGFFQGEGMKYGTTGTKQGVGLLLCLLLSLGALLGTAHMVQAQERTGTLTGTLKDASGGVLPGVTVALTNNRTGRVTTVVTDGAGMYRADLDPGNYKVRFELSGFAPQENPDVTVELGRTFTIDAAMKVGSLNEAVQVTAENAPLVDTRSTLIAHNVTAEEIERLPKGRSFQSIALTAPSVNSGDVEGGFQVNG